MRQDRCAVGTRHLTNEGYEIEVVLWAESPEKALNLLHRAEASTRGVEFKVEENGDLERVLMVRSYGEYKRGQEGWN